MNYLFKLFGIENRWSGFNGNIKKLGWAKACQKLTGDLGIEVSKSIKVIPKSGAVIITSNHPTGFDPYLLSGILNRNDSYFWGDIYQTKKGPGIASHIIPIAPRPFWTIILRPITNWPGFIQMRLNSPSLDPKMTKEINGKSLNKTVKLLKNGHQIIIFPSGGEYEFLLPKRGLAKVVGECKKQKIKVKIINLEIKKFGEMQLFFHFVFKTKIKAIIS